MASRRQILQGSLGAAALTAVPGILSAQSRPAENRTLRVVMNQDLRVFDPVVTQASVTSYHSAMIYDQLFGVDANMAPKPQMVSKYRVSDDRRTYTFELRGGLKFSDGSAVTASDCVASMRRWGAADISGKSLFARVSDTPIKDDSTFQIVLKEPYGLVLDSLSKVTTSCLYIMRKKEAETDPSKQISEIIGSGPFTYNRELSRSGDRYVYDRNPNYAPRPEPPSGTSGGKVAKLDRIIWNNIVDEQTALAALQGGEIDFYETPPLDLISNLETDSKITVGVLHDSGWLGMIRLNHLHPPFNNVKARQAMLHMMNQNDILTAAVGNPKYFSGCGALFGCGTPMENDANTGWLREGQNLARAKQLFQEAGYDGRPIVNTAAQLVAQWLRQIGAKVELQASDAGSMIARRAVKDPPEHGGWNIFPTYTSGAQVSSPILYWGHSAAGVNGGYLGWPSNEQHEKLRTDWTMAETTDERKAIARQMQAGAWDWVPHVPFGRWLQPAAWRSNVKGLLPIDEVIPFWNVEKTQV
jgi:peptide/nickel transport system substrate-binding protein